MNGISVLITKPGVLVLPCPPSPSASSVAPETLSSTRKLPLAPFLYKQGALPYLRPICGLPRATSFPQTPQMS